MIFNVGIPDSFFVQVSDEKLKELRLVIEVISVKTQLFHPGHERVKIGFSLEFNAHKCRASRPAVLFRVFKKSDVVFFPQNIDHKFLQGPCSLGKTDHEIMLDALMEQGSLLDLFHPGNIVVPATHYPES